MFQKQIPLPFTLTNGSLGELFHIPFPEIFVHVLQINGKDFRVSELD